MAECFTEIISKIAKEHSLSNLTPVSNMRFNYVASGCQSNKPIILKISLNRKECAREVLALKAFESHGAVKVLAHDDNMIIMQRLMPGVTLKDYFPANDHEPTRILCSVIKKLHLASIPKNHNFDNVRVLLKTLDQDLDIPAHILAKARRLGDTLLGSTKKEVLLHGDLHHDNIVKNGNDWLVIDPKGFIGDPAFEPAAYLSNPIPELLQVDHPRSIIQNRTQSCSEQLGISQERIVNWLYVKSVLCWAWSLEDRVDAGYWHKFLEQISALKLVRGNGFFGCS